jgi:hypothetical protein
VQLAGSPLGFVVHFRTNSEGTHGCVAGRVEHVVSGQATHFQSLEELLAFIARVLKRCAPSRPTNPSGRAAGRRGARNEKKGDDGP